MPDSEIAIRVEGLSKRYKIGIRGTHADELRGRLANAAAAPFRKLFSRNGKSSSSPRGERLGEGASSSLTTDSPLTTDNRQLTTDPSSVLWALRDVSFEVKRGEILGIIGRNGAGKSTLLKILSRITEPTEGRVEMKGRLAALLEVGTGFHPELTGRENVYLNGCILGMTKAEIDRHFDEIVDFADVEKFIDTPVKRYSSGMHVRLGFAVAAHLRPETLVVDEVLAVGDSRFQKKCIGKLQDESTKGRTVLIVSHNMHVIRNLCRRGLLLDSGQLVAMGSSERIVERYIASSGTLPSQKAWHESEAPATDKMRLISVSVLDADRRPSSHVRIDRKVGIEIVYDVLQDLECCYACFWLRDGGGTEVLSTSSSPRVTSTPDEFCGKPMKPGRYRALCWFPPDFLNATHYTVTPIIGITTTEVLIRDAITFEVADTSDMRAEYQGRWLGVVRPKLPWSTELVGNGEISSSSPREAHRLPTRP